MYEHGMIAPVVALTIWSFFMLIWLYATRIPAMQQAKIDPEKLKDDPTAKERLPVGPRRVAANYAHLMEQPTVFYAVCFALQFLAMEADAAVHPINIGLAWAYVALRVVHSLVQATVNVIMVRFLIFAVSSLVLGALIVHAAMASGLVQFSFSG
ncbi:MAG: MAPEG family protein [Terricaulis sp.]